MFHNCVWCDTPMQKVSYLEYVKVYPDTDYHHGTNYLLCQTRDKHPINPPIRRYERREDLGDRNNPRDTTCDIYYVDRLTGKEVLHYDGADPANTNPAYGGISDEEMFSRRGLDYNAEIDITKSVVPIGPGEAERHVLFKKNKLQREQEEADAKDLMELLGDAASNFDFAEYVYGEKNILEPLLEAKGYTHVTFYMIEQDSFGPLIRGCAAIAPDGKRVRFFYG
jgi:hypothetical protein